MSDPVLLLHSGGMSQRQWRKLSEALAPTHEVIAPDFLGSGEQPAWPQDKPFVWTEDFAIIEQRLLSLTRPAHLVGHSYGGLIAVTLAQRHPGRVTSLTAFDPVAFGVLHDSQDREGLADLAKIDEDPIFTDPVRGGNEAWLQAFIDYWNDAPGAWQALAPQGREAFVRVGRKVFLEASTLTRDRTPSTVYAQITTPTLLLTGERTPIAAKRVVAVLGRTIPNVRVVEIPGAGHMGPITHTAAVNALIVAHIAANSHVGVMGVCGETLPE